MSGGSTEEPVKSAIPVPDLSVLDEALGAGGDALAKALRRLRPADVGRDLSRRDPADVKRIVEASDDRRAAAMMRIAHPAVAATVLASCESARVAKVLGFLSTDHQVSILGHMSAEDRAKVEGAMDAPERETVEKHLAFPESSVARSMTPKVWKANEDVTVRDALLVLRNAGDDIEVGANCYVVDAAGVLVGVAALRELAVVPGDDRLDAHMVRDVIAVSEKTERGDAAEIIQTHDFLSLPVIDEGRRLVGAVRVDDLLDAALAEVGTGILNQGGVSGSIAGALPYFQTPLWKVVRSRITWLVLLFVAETLTGTVLRHFEDELAKVVALSFFIPLLIGTGGNAGSQTVSTVIRALALGEIRTKDAPRVLIREVSVGLALGVLLGLVAYGRAMMWGVSGDLAGCVAITVLVVCTWANFVGSMIPIGAQRVGVDPTVVSGPLITTLVDASGLFIYLTVAKLTVKALTGH